MLRGMTRILFYPIAVMSLDECKAPPTGFCPACRVALDREYTHQEPYLFCTSCDFRQSEYGG